MHDITASVKPEIRHDVLRHSISPPHPTHQTGATEEGTTDEEGIRRKPKKKEQRNAALDNAGTVREGNTVLSAIVPANLT